ncbi:LysR family transcriptional regulator [Marmoricola endophyticus]|uniref:LysR family transcriptional regulator n=1 Tax=Marmoricola endophyticus TaxID=2040280 RepID=A0A917F9U0_9ACTN|nr:LysR family transcriptional regulator [Marmoricola endophyticus]GGF56125.1 LysR family transcriptional regulator [Marmoricola endophyticus]
MPHVPDLAGLRLLVAVARTGSIGGAARELAVTQQSASERLRAVEAQVGLTLVRRGARGSSLTDEGVVVVEWASQLLELSEEIEHAIAGLRSERSRELAVWSSMTVAESLLPRWLVLLRQRQEREGHVPSATSLHAANSAEVEAAVTDGRAHVGFVEGATAPEHLRSTEVGRDELVLVVAPGHRLTRRREPVPAAEVAALDRTSREQGSGTRGVVDAAFETAGVEALAPAVELSTAAAVRESVRAGSPPAFLSRRSVERDLAAGQLVEVPTTGLDLRRSLRALWSGSAQPPAGPVRDLVGIARTHT